MQFLTSQPTATNNQNIQAAYANLTTQEPGKSATATITITPTQEIYYLTLCASEGLGKVRDSLSIQGEVCGCKFQAPTVDIKDCYAYVGNIETGYTEYSSAVDNNYANWVSVTGLPFKLPKGLAWIASGG